MKKFLIASGVAVLAFATIAGAQGYAFNTNLTVGSTGPDVVALQTWLIANHFNIPSIASGAASMGYFGSQTAGAVKLYQASVGVPNTGFVGPLTRGKLNSGSAASVVPGGTCPAGMTCTPVNPAMTACPAGYVCTPVGGGAPVGGAGIMTPGIAGTLAFALQSTPSNGTSVDKGGSADIARYKLQAGASDMAVSSLAVDFDSRFWLYASTITIKDDAGNVLATKSGLTQNDFTEITVGSDYRVYIPVSYVVSKAAIKYLTVSVSLLPVTDRSAATLSITQAQIRSVDGTGVTDTETESADRSFSYTGSNNGNVVVTLDAASPQKRLVQLSTSAETNDVPIAIYDIKSINKDGSLRSISFTVRTTGASGSGGPAASTIFQDIKLKVGSQMYSADSVGSTTSFTNIQPPIFLAKDTYVPVTILVKVAKDTSNVFDGVTASTTLVATGTNGGTTNVPSVEDSTFNTIAVNSGTFISSDAIFSASSAALSGLTMTLGTPIMNNNVTTAYPVTANLTLTAGDNTLYIAANPAVVLGTTSTGYAASANASSTLTVVTASPGTIAGDAATSSINTTAYYVIPAGSSRTFKYDGALLTHSTTGLKTFSITQFNYGTASSALTANNITYGLESLKVSPVF